MSNDGGRAFPVCVADSPTHGVVYGIDGMSLRDYFAGQAIAGALAYSGQPWDTIEREAERAYQIADAMLAARSKEAASNG